MKQVMNVKVIKDLQKQNQLIQFSFNSTQVNIVLQNGTFSIWLCQL